MLNKLTSYLAVLILFLALANLAVTNTFAGRGQLVSDLEQEVAILKHQNLKLQLQIAQAASLTHLANQLEANQFQTPKKITVIRTQTPVAMR